MKKMSEKKRFSVLARINSVTHAFRGLCIFLKTSHNAWGHLFFAAIAIYLGIILNISMVEWMILIIIMSMVILCEMINTAIEIDIDLTSPNYHPYARDTKDVAAGAVSVAVFIAGTIGILIFLPKILALI